MDSLTHKLRTEPVVLLAVLVAVVQAVCTFVAGGGALTFAALVPIVCGAIGRQLVMPANGLTLGHPEAMEGDPPVLGVDGGNIAQASATTAGPGSVDIIAGPKDAG